MSNQDVPRVVMISGANRGIGRAIAERLYEDGYRLSLGARRLESLRALTQDMAPDRVLEGHYQATDPDSVKSWVTRTAERFGGIDAVVCNAGVMHPLDIEDEDEAPLDAMYEINVKGPLRLVRAAFAHLKRSGQGRFINVVSLSGLRVKSAGVGAYAVSKHASAALTHWVRHAGWDDGIRATSICPGLVATDMTSSVTAVRAPDMTQPQSVAHLVSSVLVLPNNASVVELPVNCALEPTV